MKARIATTIAIFVLLSGPALAHSGDHGAIFFATGLWTHWLQSPFHVGPVALACAIVAAAAARRVFRARGKRIDGR